MTRNLILFILTMDTLRHVYNYSCIAPEFTITMETIYLHNINRIMLNSHNLIEFELNF